MKIKTVYHSHKLKDTFKCTIHIEDKVVTRITTNDKKFSENELENIQPYIFGTKNYGVIKYKKSINNNPYQFFYNSRDGQISLPLKYSKIGFYVLRERLKIKNTDYINYFIAYSTFVLLGVIMAILMGEIIIKDFGIIIFVWSIMAFISMRYLINKNETLNKEIEELKKLNQNMNKFTSN